MGLWNNQTIIKNPLKIFVVILLVILSFFMAKSLYLVLSAPTIKVHDFEYLSLFFSRDQYSERYNNDLWKKHNVCSDIFCWSHYTFSPLFPHIIEPEWIIDSSVFHILTDKLSNIPYMGSTILRDRLFNVYWIDDYGPFKVIIEENIVREELAATTHLRPYDDQQDSPYEVSDIEWNTSISNDSFTIQPHIVIHKEGRNPEIQAYREGNKIVVKDVYEYGSTWTVVSGTVSFDKVPSGDYDLIYLRNENGIPSVGGSTSDNRDIVGYERLIKQ